MKIYLAGGFGSLWRINIIYNNRKKAHFLNPEKHQLKIPSQYTNMDLHMIDECDLVFAYIESDNPGGYNTIFELGYAYGLGKPIIFISEKEDWNQYSKMIQERSLFYSNSLQEGTEFLERYLEIIERN